MKDAVLGQSFCFAIPNIDCSSHDFHKLSKEAFERASKHHSVIFSDPEYSTHGTDAVAKAYVVGTNQVMAVPVEDMDA